MKLASGAAPPSGLTTSCRPSHPSPKLSNSCNLTRAVACGAGGTDGGGGGGCLSCNGGGLTGGLECSGAEDGRDGAGQMRAPNAASMKIAARTSLRVTRATSASVSESSFPCERRETRASRNSIAVRCDGSCGGCSHSLTRGPIPAAVCGISKCGQGSAYLGVGVCHCGGASGRSGKCLCIHSCDGMHSLSMLRHPVGVDHDSPRRSVQHGAGDEYVEHRLEAAPQPRRGELDERTLRSRRWRQLGGRERRRWC